ncbi:NAD(P)/FAD-dependent oxidoreductase [Sulfuricella sp.]|uniref:NAD(P)/FAD-dependent oxidoreductase n=1 Tax=Sulfuricella sp. TaxID=2099377 RepID=UPI002D0BBA1F|nr:FAD-dependent oxidoreductase [Sulfuricella sp.]HUX64018.1 FAD-dependent oxidoreductase [Sulfuricella sp.]
MNQPPVVIIGSGLAGFTVAREFRKLDGEAPLVMLSSDHGGFYSKPMLSNAFAQKKDADALLGKSSVQMAEELKLEIRAHARVTAIDVARKQLTVNGETVPYGKLVLAMGADPIRLPLHGDGADAVLSVNDHADYRRFREAIEGKKDIAILGAGLIGCEFANDLVGAGYNVHVIDLAPQPLGRLLPPASAAFMQRKLEAAGIIFHLGTTTQQVEHAGEGFRMTLSNGVTLAADVVLSAVGLRPRNALAESAGIKVNRGIVVNASLQTSDEDVYALGDCAEVEGRVLPFVMPIMQAARALAPTLAGTATQARYPAMPVVVKTPACPAVVSPPDMGVHGEWQVEEVDDGVRALFRSADGKLLGFALLGTVTVEKNALTAQLPPVME